MPENPKPDAPHLSCKNCAHLLDEEYAYQKYGAPENDSHLPAARHDLKIVKNFKPYDSRKLQLRQCPECGTYYLYRSDYEYHVNGSEDEEFLTRLTDADAAEYLRRPAPTAAKALPIPHPPSAIQNPQSPSQSKIKNYKLKIRNPQSAIRNPKSPIPHPPTFLPSNDMAHQ
jgi:hypothetical protein